MDEAAPIPEDGRPAQAAAADDLLDAAPGLARIAAGAWLRTADWAASSALRAGRRAARVASGAESALDVLRDARLELGPRSSGGWPPVPSSPGSTRR